MDSFVSGKKTFEENMGKIIGENGERIFCGKYSGVINRD